MPFEAAERCSLTDAVPLFELQRHINAYIFASNFVKHKNVLDMASGEGTGSTYLINNDAKRVIGADVSKHALSQALLINTGKKAEFVLLNGQSIPFADNSFDVVVSFETIEHTHNPDMFLKECKRVIKNGGTIICSTPNKSITSPFFKTPVNPYHLKEFYAQEFYSLMSTHFINITAYGQHLLGLKKRILLQTQRFAANLFATVFKNRTMLQTIANAYRTLTHEKYTYMNSSQFDSLADNDYGISQLSSDSKKVPRIIIVAGQVSK